MKVISSLDSFHHFMIISVVSVKLYLNEVY